MTTRDTLLKTIADLVAEGEAVMAKREDAYMGGHLLPGPLAEWLGGCKNLLRMLGNAAGPWEAGFVSDNKHERSGTFGERMLGTLRGILKAVDNGLLLKVEDLIYAEAFDNLLEQADNLFAQKYWLPAGVLGRAVLEQHLRKWCDHAGCAPSKAKPTMSDFYSELQKAGHLNALGRKHVEAMVGVGNDCAHVKSNVQAQDVERFLRDVRDFLLRHPLT